MKRRPDRLTEMRISLGRRVIEPESFVSSSCVGGSVPSLEPQRIEIMLERLDQRARNQSIAIPQSMLIPYQATREEQKRSNRLLFAVTSVDCNKSAHSDARVTCRDFFSIDPEFTRRSSTRNIFDRGHR